MSENQSMFHGGLSVAARSLVAVNEAFRVLRPGGGWKVS